MLVYQKVNMAMGDTRTAWAILGVLKSCSVDHLKMSLFMLWTWQFYAMVWLNICSWRGFCTPILFRLLQTHSNKTHFSKTDFSVRSDDKSTLTIKVKPTKVSCKQSRDALSSCWSVVAYIGLHHHLTVIYSVQYPLNFWLKPYPHSVKSIVTISMKKRLQSHR